MHGEQGRRKGMSLVEHGEERVHTYSRGPFSRSFVLLLPINTYTPTRLALRPSTRRGPRSSRARERQWQPGRCAVQRCACVQPSAAGASQGWGR